MRLLSFAAVLATAASLSACIVPVPMNDRCRALYEERNTMVGKPLPPLDRYAFCRKMARGSEQGIADCYAQLQANEAAQDYQRRDELGRAAWLEQEIVRSCR